MMGYNVRPEAEQAEANSIMPSSDAPRTMEIMSGSEESRGVEMEVEERRAVLRIEGNKRRVLAGPPKNTDREEDLLTFQ